MNISKALKIVESNTELNTSIERWTQATTDQTLTRAKDINRDKTRAVQSFFNAGRRNNPIKLIHTMFSNGSGI